MATVLRIRDQVDVVRLVNALVDSAEALERTGLEADRNEARARMILSNRIADELDAAEQRGVPLRR